MLLSFLLKYARCINDQLVDWPGKRVYLYLYDFFKKLQKVMFLKPKMAYSSQNCAVEPNWVIFDNKFVLVGTVKRS